MQRETIQKVRTLKNRSFVKNNMIKHFKTFAIKTYESSFKEITFHKSLNAKENDDFVM